MRVHQIRVDFAVTEQVKRYVFVYLIEAKSCYLIDSGVYGSEEQITQYMKTIGRNISEVKAVFLTHAHPDHIGTAAWFQEHTGCKIYASQGERAWIENIDQQYQERPIPNFYKLAGKSTEVDVTVQNGDLIPLEENLNIQVISTPGHSVDGVSYRLGKSLFLGDAISVKDDIPIYINVHDTFKTLQTIRDLDGICNYYPAWDHTYSVSDIDEKINDAERIVCTLDEQVHTILEDGKETDITVITNLVCERLKMPYLKENPLLRKTIWAHCLNHGNF